MADIGRVLYAASVEVYFLDSNGNVRSFLPSLSDRGEAAFTPPWNLRWKPDFNALTDIAAPNWATRGKRVIVWSGWLGESVFERDPGTWGPRGLESLRACVERLAESARSGGYQVLLRPHARHVLCDVQRTLKLLHEWREWPIGLALDAASMLEASIAGQAEDHFRRAYETLGAHCGAVIVANVVPPADEEAPMQLVSLENGVVRGERILELVAANVPSEVPRVAVFEDDAGRIAGADRNR